MLPEIKRRRASFMLTPLIDVIFLLLVFFMLSSQIAPYSLLPMGGVASAREEPIAAADEPASQALPVVVRIARGQLHVGGETMAISDLRAAAERFRREGTESYLLIPTRSAEVQDIVSTLEALKAASAATVTLLNRQRAVP
jgi:biopolymer transport protein ExbD